MLSYEVSLAYLSAMKSYSKVGSGKIYGYETYAIPIQDNTLSEWEENR